MSASGAPETLRSALDATLDALGLSARRVDLPDSSFPGPHPFASTYERSRTGEPVFAVTTAALVSGAYRSVRDDLVRPRANVKIVADASSGSEDDLGALRGLPGLTIAVPADAPSLRAAVTALAAFDGPAYLRLAGGPRPSVTSGTFEIGRAPALRDGADLTVVAIGAMVGRALEVATELARVGLSTRVLDFASFKPHDEKALLRAARDTGGILTLEDHSVLTGLGALVAETVAEESPVPVRRVGLPDLFALDGAPPTESPALALDRCLEEAWTVLRARGKVQ